MEIPKKHTHGMRNIEYAKSFRSFDVFLVHFTRSFRLFANVTRRNEAEGKNICILFNLFRHQHKH